MKTTYDIYKYIHNLMATINIECYDMPCECCDVNVSCMMLSISARDVLGGAY
jgi:hypothetical protein